MGTSAWTNDSVTTLVVPTGATTGARVVINGVTGQIQVYDSTNTLVGQIDSQGMETFASDGSAALMSAGATQWFGPTTPHTVVAAFAQAISGSGLSEFRIVGPSEDSSTFADTAIVMSASRGNTTPGQMAISSQSVAVSNDAPGGGASVTCGTPGVQPGALQLKSRGARAYVFTSPPTNYDASSILTLTTTSVLVPGCSASYTGMGLSARWRAFAKVDSVIGVVAVTNVGELWVQVNGAGFVKMTEEIDIGSGASTRIPAAGAWSGTGGNNNVNNTLDFELRGKFVGGGGGTNQFLNIHTTLQIEILE